MAGDAADVACTDVWAVMSTARTIRRFTAEPVDDATVAKCLQAAREAGFATASELLLAGSIFPAVQNFLLAARALGLGACLTSCSGRGNRGTA
ncbi:MAG: hypothetical protein JWM19_7847 [Actinomycetia bacterium]|nr:hypothetical protein [Actinomycetes bacterium]